MSRDSNRETENLNKKRPQTAQETRFDQTMMDPEAIKKRAVTRRNVVDLDQLKPGDRILDEFEVVRFLGKGGAGAVYLVKRVKLEDVFAAKIPIRDVMSRERTRKLFFREIRTWIGLPEHPHLTACRFVRSLDQQIIIFAEFVDGGSLVDMIIEKKLLTIEKILDVAIQMAWGLKAAHDSNVVHQDVKPSNVLVSKDGTVKITDFGLSRAFQTLDDLQQEGSDDGVNGAKGSGGEKLISVDPDIKTASVSSGIMTPMYCSPEQSDRKQVDYRTDIWSWGVSVLSMFTGPARWISGAVAGSIMEGYIKRGAVEPYPAIPKPVADVLRKCFKLNPDERWQSMGDVAEALIEVFKELTGAEYERTEPEALSSPEFRGKMRDTENLARAFELLGRDPRELDALSDGSGTTHKAHVLQRIEMYYEVGLKLRELNILDNAEYRHLFVQLMLEKSELHRLINDLDGSQAIADQVINLFKMVSENSKTQTDCHLEGAAVYEKGIAFMRRMELKDAVDLFGEALRLWTSYAENTDTKKAWAAVANAHNACTVTWHTMGETDRALESQENAVKVLQMLVDRGESGFEMALSGYMNNLAVILTEKGRSTEAFEYHSRAISLVEKLYYEDGQTHLKHGLATNYLNMACDLFAVKRWEEAVEFNNKAIKFLEELLHDDGDMDVRLFLARVYMNKGNALDMLDQGEEALEQIGRGREMIRQLLFVEGNTALIEELVFFERNMAMTLLGLKRIDEARRLLEESRDAFVKRYVNRDRNTYRWLHTMLLNNLSSVEQAAGNPEVALELLEQAVNMVKEEDVEMTSVYVRYFRLTVWNYLAALTEWSMPDEIIQCVDDLVDHLNRLKRVASEDDYAEMIRMIEFFKVQARGRLGEKAFARENMTEFLEFMKQTSRRKPEDTLDKILEHIETSLTEF